MKHWQMILLFIVSVITQCSLLNIFEIGGYTPNLTLIMVVILSFMYYYKPWGVVYGAAFGLLYDVCYGGIIGPTAISMMAAGILMLRLGQIVDVKADIRNVLFILLLTMVDICVYYVVNWGIYTLLGYSISIFGVLDTVLHSGIYTLAIIALVYIVMINNMYKKTRAIYMKKHS